MIFKDDRAKKDIDIVKPFQRYQSPPTQYHKQKERISNREYHFFADKDNFDIDYLFCKF